jgi:lysyl-tRNA synthetase class I
MIYSKAFEGMPDYVKQGVYRRLYDVLTGKDQSPKFAKLSADDRHNVLEIVRATKPNLPAYWREASLSAAAQ